jgi:putative transposase
LAEYILHKGFLYPAAVMDRHSRKVPSRRLPDTMETDFCLSAPAEALAKYCSPDIFNTGQDSQFTSFAFTNVLPYKGIRISMDGRGRRPDSVFIKRLRRSLKYENVYLNAYETGCIMGIGKLPVKDAGYMHRIRFVISKNLDS